MGQFVHVYVSKIVGLVVFGFDNTGSLKNWEESQVEIARAYRFCFYYTIIKARNRVLPALRAPPINSEFGSRDLIFAELTCVNHELERAVGLEPTVFHSSAWKADAIAAMRCPRF